MTGTSANSFGSDFQFEITGGIIKPMDQNEVGFTDGRTKFTLSGNVKNGLKITSTCIILSINTDKLPVSIHTTSWKSFQDGNLGIKISFVEASRYGEHGNAIYINFKPNRLGVGGCGPSTIGNVRDGSIFVVTENSHTLFVVSQAAEILNRTTWNFIERFDEDIQLKVSYFLTKAVH